MSTVKVAHPQFITRPLYYAVTKMVTFFPPFRFSQRFPSQKSTVASLVLYSKAKRCGPAVSTTRGQATAETAGNTGNTRARALA